jgi:radical SAM family uncharacterized protein
MASLPLKEYVAAKLLPCVQTPGQYVGGELNAIVKDARSVAGRICLCFPDAYSIGMSHYGLQVLYAVMNRGDWACERAFAPLADMEPLMREHGVPLFSLETYTPLAEFDVVGFTLQYDLCYTNVLTMLDLGGIPLRAADRTADAPLVVGGGPCAVNPEPMAPFFDAFVIGDGEETLPAVADAWLRSKGGGLSRGERLLRLVGEAPHVYVPRFYEATYAADGRPSAMRRLRDDVPSLIGPAVADLSTAPLPTSPIVPLVETVQDRIALEIMRGCPGRCRFCQSTTTKRPVRFRSVDSIIEAALEAYRNTGHNEISLLSLSTSDYPHFDALMQRLQETFRPLGVSISLPSLRINEQLQAVGELMNTDRRSGLTLAPEVALDDMRASVGKPLTNDDLYAGCRTALENGFSRVKLYFMCGLPGERPIDLDGMIDMADRISRMGKEVGGRFATVVANVSNFVPKPQTPYQWNAMQRREYFRDAHRRLFERMRWKTVQLRCHDTEASLLEGVLCRGDRRVAEAIELVWRRGARFDSWAERLQPRQWWDALAEAQIDVEQLLHAPYPVDAPLPWDHIGIRQGRDYLLKESSESRNCMSTEDEGTQ